MNSNNVNEACRDIHCDFDATCELGPDNFPRCTCHFDCASPMGGGGGKSVCASDMRLYPSVCVMKMEGCQRQEELRLRPLDLCEGVVVCCMNFRLLHACLGHIPACITQGSMRS